MERETDTLDAKNRMAAPDTAAPARPTAVGPGRTGVLGAVRRRLGSLVLPPVLLLGIVALAQRSPAPAPTGPATARLFLDPQDPPGPAGAGLAIPDAVLARAAASAPDISRAGLSARAGGEPGSVLITAEGSPPVAAASRANAVAQAWLAERAAARRLSAGRAAEGAAAELTRQAAVAAAAASAAEAHRADLARRVEEANARVQGWTRDHPPAEARAIRGRRLALVHGLAAARTRVREAQARAERAAAAVRAGPLRAAETGTAPARLRTALALQMRRRAELGRRYGPRYPLMIATESAIRGILGEIAAHAERSAASARAAIGPAEAEAATAERNLARASAAAARSTESSARLADLQRDLTAARAALAAAPAVPRTDPTQPRPVAAPAGDAAAASGDRLLAPATAPAAPDRPFPWRLAAVALLIGLALGIALAWWRERRAARTLGRASDPATDAPAPAEPSPAIAPVAVEPGPVEPSPPASAAAEPGRSEVTPAGSEPPAPEPIPGEPHLAAPEVERPANPEALPAEPPPADATLGPVILAAAAEVPLHEPVDELRDPDPSRVIASSVDTERPAAGSADPEGPEAGPAPSADPETAAGSAPEEPSAAEPVEPVEAPADPSPSAPAEDRPPQFEARPDTVAWITDAIVPIRLIPLEPALLPKADPPAEAALLPEPRPQSGPSPVPEPRLAASPPPSVDPPATVLPPVVVPAPPSPPARVRVPSAGTRPGEAFVAHVTGLREAATFAVVSAGRSREPGRSSVGPVPTDGPAPAAGAALGAVPGAGAAPMADGVLDALVRGRTSGARLRKIVLAASGEGVDTASAALAIARAATDAGFATLVVDLNPTLQLTGRLRPTPRFGVSDVLRGLVPLDEAAVRIRVGPDAVLVLAAGSPLPHQTPPEAAELQAQLVERVRLADVVVLDCGAPDGAATAFAALGEGVTVLVVPDSGNGEAERLHARLVAAGATMGGCMVVDAPRP